MPQRYCVRFMKMFYTQIFTKFILFNFGFLSSQISFGSYYVQTTSENPKYIIKYNLELNMRTEMNFEENITTKDNTKTVSVIQFQVKNTMKDHEMKTIFYWASFILSITTLFDKLHISTKRFFNFSLEISLVLGKRMTGNRLSWIALPAIIATRWRSWLRLEKEKTIVETKRKTCSFQLTPLSVVICMVKAFSFLSFSHKLPVRFKRKISIDIVHCGKNISYTGSIQIVAINKKGEQKIENEMRQKCISSAFNSRCFKCQPSIWFWEYCFS